MSSRLQRRNLSSIQSPTDQGFEIHSFLEESFRTEPHAYEANIISRIEKHIEEYAGPLFEEADSVLESFYKRVRKQATEYRESVGMVPKFDEKGYPVYEKDEQGNFIEDWSLLTGQDTEEAIFGLQRVVGALQDHETKLFLRAKLAHEISEDTFYEAYSRPVEGTVNDRTAAGRRKSKDERYYYFYCYWWYKRVSDKLEFLKDVLKRIEFTASRYIKRETESNNEGRRRLG